MNDARLRELLERVRRGDIAVHEAAAELRGPTADFATLDHGRAERCGHPEIVYGPGKTPAQAAAIARELHERAGRLLVTRVTPEQAAAVVEAVPEAAHDPVARVVAALPADAPARPGICIVSAGTADMAVAEEARWTCRFLGAAPAVLRDVGVAGIHRLLDRADELRAARVVIAVAGMEGALPSVVGGLVKAPVIAVPTSTGYGTGLGGAAALLTMLNSCASNVVCVNIDNGVSAAVSATLMIPER